MTSLEVRMLFRFFMVVALAALSGCANNSGVFQVGDHQYQVSTRATWELGGRAGAKRMALEEASKYCGKLGKTVKVISSNEDYNHFEGGTVDLIFDCQ